MEHSEIELAGQSRAESLRSYLRRVRQSEIVRVIQGKVPKLIQKNLKGPKRVQFCVQKGSTLVPKVLKGPKKGPKGPFNKVCPGLSWSVQVCPGLCHSVYFSPTELLKRKRERL